MHMEQAAPWALPLVEEELAWPPFGQELKVSRVRPWACSPAEHGAMKPGRAY
jgi:hypothetical protein